MTIRHARPTDLDALEQQCFPPEEAATRTSFAQRLAVFPEHFWLAEEDGQILACVNGCVSDSPLLQDEMFEDAGLHNEQGDYVDESGAVVDDPVKVPHENNYYQIPVCEGTALERNTCYEVSLALNVPGGTDPSEPVELGPINYLVREWDEQTIDIGGETDRPEYLTLNEEEFEMHKNAIKDPVRQKRAKHAVYENQRTIRAVEALKNNDVELFGKLMNASHKSLREDYEVSCEEIDILVDLAQAMPGVVGSRITGGGFGGCTVSIVKNDTVDEFIDSIGKAYQEKVGHEAEFYVVDIGDGARKLEQ